MIGSKEFRKRVTTKLLQVSGNIKEGDLIFSQSILGYRIAYRPCYPESSNGDFDVWQETDGTITVRGNFQALIPTINKYKDIEDFETRL